MDIPAAAVTACCSAIPTSMNRSGNRASKGSRPVGPGMAAVMATRLGSVSACSSSDRVKASVKVVGGMPAASPETGASVSGVAGAAATVLTLTSWRRWTSSSSAGA